MRGHGSLDEDGDGGSISGSWRMNRTILGRRGWERRPTEHGDIEWECNIVIYKKDVFGDHGSWLTASQTLTIRAMLKCFGHLSSVPAITTET